MDWAAATAHNRDALLRIVAALFAMLGLQGGGVTVRIPRALRRTVLRVLMPAESAARRLIVIAARGLVVKFAPSRPKPAMPPKPKEEGRVIGTGGSRRLAFRLFDRRKRFGRERIVRNTKNPPRITFFGPDPRVSIFRAFRQPEPAPAPAPLVDDSADAGRLGRRLEALNAALGDLPRQARRLARLRARREQGPPSARLSPLRPGPPPGHRRKPSHDVDFVLTECHGLAWEVVQSDTS